MIDKSLFDKDGKFQFDRTIKKDVEEIIELCNFTELQKEIFICRTKGLYHYEIADRLNISDYKEGIEWDKVISKISRIK